MDADSSLSLILFSGTDDKLTSAAVLISGAAAMGRRVNVFLQYWALDALRRGNVDRCHGVAPEAGSEGARLVDEQQKALHWSEMLRQAKDIGEVKVSACAKSMEMFGITKDDLDPLVDDIGGIAAFVSDATGAITFI